MTEERKRLTRRSGTSAGPPSNGRSRGDGRSACGRRRAAGWRPRRRVSSAAAQGGADVELVVVQQAEMEAAVGGEPHAVAACRSTARSPGLMKPTTPRASGERDELRDSSDGSRAGQRRRAGRAPPRCVRGSRALRHESAAGDLRRVSPAPSGIVSMKRTCQGALERERRERDDVLVVEAADDDGVQLDRGEARRLRRLDAGPDLGERAPAHDARQALRVEAVEVDVDAAQAGRASVRSRDAAAGCRWSSSRGPARRECAPGARRSRRGRRAASARRRSGGTCGTRRRPRRAPPARSRRPSAARGPAAKRRPCSAACSRRSAGCSDR